MSICWFPQIIQTNCDSWIHGQNFKLLEEIFLPEEIPTWGYCTNGFQWVNEPLTSTPTFVQSAVMNSAEKISPEFRSCWVLPFISRYRISHCSTDVPAISKIKFITKIMVSCKIMKLLLFLQHLHGICIISALRGINISKINSDLFKIQIYFIHMKYNPVNCSYFYSLNSTAWILFIFSQRWVNSLQMLFGSAVWMREVSNLEAYFKFRLIYLHRQVLRFLPSSIWVSLHLSQNTDQAPPEIFCFSPFVSASLFHL